MAIELMSPIHTSQVAFQASQRPVAEPKPAPAADIQHAVTQMNTLSQVINHRLTFSVDHDTNDIIVKVIDADTEKLIREMPAVELQKLHKSIKDAVGLLINKLI
jgi:flagellar protein FlaG